MSEQTTAQAAPIIETTPTPPPEAVKAMAPQDPQTYEIKIDGKVHKMTLSDLQKNAGLGLSATQRFEEASKMRNEAAAIQQVFQGEDFTPETIRKVASKFNISREKLIAGIEQWYKQEVIDPEAMTEEQRRIAELERQLQAKEELERQVKEREQRTQQEQVLVQARVQLQKDIMAILDAAGLPKTQKTTRDLAYLMRVNNAKKLDLPNEVLVEQLKTARREEDRSFLKDASDEQLIEWLGDDLVKKVRQYDLTQLKNKFHVKDKVPPVVAQKAEKKTMADVDNYFNELRRAKR